jgi:Ca-activated chloride channel family protein
MGWWDTVVPWFAHPWAFSLLAVLPVLAVIAVLAERRRRRTLARFGSRPALQTLAATRGGWRWLRRTCLLNGLLLLIAGIAGPRWGRDWEQSAAQGRDLVLVLDLSRSMLAQDVLPSRVERARKALEELTYTIQQHGGHRVALVTFAARARIVCPLTHDYNHVRFALAELDPVHLHPDLRPAGKDAVSGTRIGAGLRMAVEALRDSGDLIDSRDPRARGYQDILLISDGDDPVQDGEWREGADVARRKNIPVHTVGVGNPAVASPIPLQGDEVLRHNKEVVTTKLEEQPLESIARMTRGTYTPAGTNVLRLGELFREGIEPGGARDTQEEVLPVYQQHASWFLGAAYFLLGMEMVLGQKRPRVKKLTTGD